MGEIEVKYWSWLGRGSWDGLRGINRFWGIRKLWDGKFLGCRGEEESIIAWFGIISWHGIGCMTLGDWIISFLVWYLDNISINNCGKNTYLLQGGGDVDFAGLGLCGGWGMGRGLG